MCRCRVFRPPSFKGGLAETPTTAQRGEGVDAVRPKKCADVACTEKNEQMPCGFVGIIQNVVAAPPTTDMEGD
ncbi:MAG: hypothetical protein IPL46_32450 [Saprospiraceae bacterium]|nr:hypothetical protein [Saprospiraceae bacterium]